MEQNKSQAMETIKVLYAEDEEELQEIITLELEAELDVEVIRVSNGLEAVKKLQEDKDIRMVISDYNMPGGNGDCIYSYIKREKLGIPFILHSAAYHNKIPTMKNFLDDNPKNRLVIKPEVFQVVETVCKLITPDFVRIGPPDYCRVATFRFQHTNNIPCDVYLKLSGTKYVKIINKDDMYDTELVRKYEAKGCRYFHVKGVDFDPFSKSYGTALSTILAKKKLTPVERSHGEQEGIALIHDQIHSMGITTEVFETVNVVVNSTIHQLRQNQQVSNLLELMTRNKNYQYAHSLMISYISIAIAVRMSWNTDFTLEKLSMAAILHDVVIEDEEIALLHDLSTPEEIEKSPWRTKELINKHPQQSYVMIERMRTIPADVGKIVQMHHEDGTPNGYPMKIQTHAIPPLAAIFIVAEEFTRNVFKQDSPIIDHLTIIDQISKKYQDRCFTKPLEGLKSSFIEII
ncbi:MAG: response regulator [Bdellovibrionales bacterium]|jgi:HD-GYP domain-containing protein (c-di-GMP phosphodiesterase class II)/CheY-like chemotaxis protein|nr:response regulator [Bdellovibrionales bacterium]MBT3527043.1 response regulator [Bdellovibrionales bacterium]MBT7669046.1 response regulator [Bdellovibrionales bacterium]MBT7767774.1 response regulator [Bdellovibrionales bacterium]